MSHLHRWKSAGREGPHLAVSLIHNPVPASLCIMLMNSGSVPFIVQGPVEAASVAVPVLAGNRNACTMHSKC